LRSWCNFGVCGKGNQLRISTGALLRPARGKTLEFQQIDNASQGYSSDLHRKVYWSKKYLDIAPLKGSAIHNALIGKLCRRSLFISIKFLIIVTLLTAAGLDEDGKADSRAVWRSLMEKEIKQAT